MQNYSSNIVGKEKIQTVHLRQKGELRTKEDGKWMPVEADQFVNVEEPAFIWNARIQAAPFIHIHGRDKYQKGKGNMLIKLLSFITIANAKGMETDQGSLLRFLGEMVWYPTAALNDYIDWEEIDSTSAKATMSYGGISASGILSFNSNGDLISFEARRYYDRNGNYTLEKWLATVEDYKEFAGFRIPVASRVTWKLKTGDFTWYKFRVIEVGYDTM